MPDRYPRRIICATEETTEVLYRLGEEHRIAGISGFTVRPPHARKEKPKVSAFTEADIPAIEALHPDLILLFSDIQAPIARDLSARGFDVVLFNQRSIDEILAAIVRTGALVGRARDAEKLADELARNVEATRERTAKAAHRPRVFFEEWPDPLISGIRWVSELIEAAGGDDLYADRRHASLAKDRIIDPAEVAAKDPELILASWCGKQVKPAQIRARPGWSNTTAVQANRIHEIDSSLILQPGPAALTDGLAALVDALQPSS
jgi:iron complex transport system substrate-binding protein